MYDKYKNTADDVHFAKMLNEIGWAFVTLGKLVTETAQEHEERHIVPLLEEMVKTSDELQKKIETDFRDIVLPVCYEEVTYPAFRKLFTEQAFNLGKIAYKLMVIFNKKNRSGTASRASFNMAKMYSGCLVRFSDRALKQYLEGRKNGKV
jgi:hypothetical protein